MSVAFPNEQSSMFSSYDFRTTVDTSRYTRAIYVALTANAAMSVTNPTGTPAAMSIPVDGQYHFFRTNVAVTVAGGLHTIIYLYDAPE